LLLQISSHVDRDPKEDPTNQLLIHLWYIKPVTQLHLQKFNEQNAGRLQFPSLAQGR
jgi:hypothetical protein